ncbi:hypothetical protein SVIOM342S_07087 [Streptomyces violaceorubidus]
MLPGIPKDATAVRLVLFTPGGTDADLKVRLASPSGLITPAGHETVHVKAGMTTGVDLGEVTRGEAGSLVRRPGSAVPMEVARRGHLRGAALAGQLSPARRVFTIHSPCSRSHPLLHTH